MVKEPNFYQELENTIHDNELIRMRRRLLASNHISLVQPNLSLDLWSLARARIRPNVGGLSSYSETITLLFVLKYSRFVVLFMFSLFIPIILVTLHRI